MKKLFTSLALSLTILAAYSQNTFIKNISQSNPIYAKDGISTSDNNSIVVGGVSNSLNVISPFIVKLDDNGDTLWTKTFSSISPRSTYMNSVKELNNGDIICSGYYDKNATNFQEPFIAKLTSSGNLVSLKTIPINLANNYSTISETRVATDGVNSYLAYPSIKTVGFNFSSISYAFINVLKLDQNLDTIWSKEIDLTPEISAAYQVTLKLNDFELTDSGNILVMHQAITSTNLQSVPLDNTPYYITKIAANGTVSMSYKIFASSNTQKIHFSSIAPISDNKIYLTGYALPSSSGIGGANKPAILELDSNLNIVNKGLYFNTRGYLNQLIKLNNGNYGVGISESTLTLGLKSAIAELDTNLNTQWLKVYGSSGTYLYTIDQDANSNILSIASSRSYSNLSHTSGVIIKSDSNGLISSCIENVDTLTTDSIAVSQTNAINYTIGADTNASNFSIPTNFINLISEDLSITYNDSIIKPLCNGLQGEIDLSITSPNSPHIFSWSNGTTAEDLNDFSAIYSVIISDKYGCLQYDTFNLIQPDIISASYTSTNVSCFGYANGAIDLTPFGGTPGYTYAWTNLATSEDLSNLSGGFYQVTISDTNGCQKVVGVSVVEPQQLISVITNTTHASCNNICDGELVAFASGGYPPYNYLWNDPMAQTNDTATGLCDGQYFATITDTNGCQTYVNGMVTEPLTLSSTMWESPTECGLSNGAAGITPSGGTAPYTIQWWGTTITNDTITGLDAGESGADVIDANGCLLRDSIDISTTTLGNEECLVSVTASDQNVIIWEKPTASNISGYNIYRNIAGSYALIGFHPYDSLSEYTDVTFGVDPNVTSYRYKVSVVDTCGFESGLSFYHETIHLTANVGINGEVNLIWDDYEGAPFNSYNIMVDSIGSGNYSLVASVSAGSFTYTDLTPPQDSANYIIEVVLDSTCTSTAKANHNTTRSNKNKVQGLGGTTVALTNLVLNKTKVYPNPARDIVNIQLPGSDKWSYQVFNVVGKLITETQNVNVDQITLSIKDWPKGVYILKLKIGKQTINKKIVKQH